ncbi:MAG: HEAT repeat domain-containing protein [Planctomycetota bacterium]|nr:HEAT repeat domain-containing protein [Planctomycetota bacterium]
MNTVIKEICELLKSSDPEMQCSAAKVLGELKPPDQEVYNLLGEMLGSGNLALKPFLLEALEKGQRKETLPYLLPLLSDENLKDRVARAIVVLGPDTLGELKQRYKEGTYSVKKSVIAILARMPNPANLSFLLELLLTEEVEVIKYLCFKMKMELAGYDENDKRLALNRLLTLFKSAKIAKNRLALIGALKLLGDLKEQKGQKVLLEYVGSDHDTGIRVTAFHALMHLDGLDGKNDSVASALLPVLDEKDFPSIVSNALNVLRRIEYPKSKWAALKVKLKSPHPEVRRYILRILAEQKATGVVRLLVDALDDPDFEVREQAVAALELMPGSAREIFEKVSKTTNFSKIKQLSPLLRGQLKDLDKIAVGRLRASFIKLFEAKDEASLAVFHLMENVDPAGLAKGIVDKAKTYKSKRQYDKARRYLEVIRDRDYFPDTGKYELAGLLLRTGKRSMGRSDRHADPALTLIAEVLRSDVIDVFKLLKSSSTFFKPEEIYYIGYHFSEKVGPEREFGLQLLGHLIKKSPKTKYGKLSQNKQNIESIE